MPLAILVDVLCDLAMLSSAVPPEKDPVSARRLPVSKMSDTPAVVVVVTHSAAADVLEHNIS